MYSELVVEVERHAVRNRSAIAPSLSRTHWARCGFGPALQRLVPPRPGNFPSYENSGRQRMEKVFCRTDEGARTTILDGAGAWKDPVREGQ